MNRSEMAVLLHRLHLEPQIVLAFARAITIHILSAWFFIISKIGRLLQYLFACLRHSRSSGSEIVRLAGYVCLILAQRILIIRHANGDFVGRIHNIMGERVGHLSLVCLIG